MNLQSPLCCASFCLTIMVAAVAVKLAPPPGTWAHCMWRTVPAFAIGAHTGGTGITGGNVQVCEVQPTSTAF